MISSSLPLPPPSNPNMPPPSSAINYPIQVENTLLDLKASTNIEKPLIEKPLIEKPPIEKPPIEKMNCKFLNSPKCHPDYPNFSGAGINFGSDSETKIKCDSIGKEKIAKAICTIGNGKITGVYLIDEGSSYEDSPNVIAVGGGGSGSKLKAMAISGKIKQIKVLDGGYGYTETPNIKIEPPNMSSGCYLCCK
jgi:hypothetical protein